MMKQPIMLLLGLLMLLGGCQKKEGETEAVTQKSEETATADVSVPSFDNDYLVSIYEAQELIKIRQDDPELRRSYCAKAYLPDRKIFVSMGIARLHHPETGAAIPVHMAEKAARLDAIRWAGYGQEWLRNNYEPAFGSLNTGFQQEIEVINQAQVGDSLFIFTATRLP